MICCGSPLLPRHLRIDESTDFRIDWYRAHSSIRQSVNLSMHSLQRHDCRLAFARHHRLALATIHVDLGAHAEVVEIQTRLDRETGPRHEPPFVMRFKV